MKFFFHPCADYVCNHTPAKSHLQTPTRKHIKSQLNPSTWEKQTDPSLKLCHIIQGDLEL